MQPENPYGRGSGVPADGTGGYQGPPPTNPPPFDWRPPVVIEPAPPRRLPAQDHLAIDEEESRARIFTRGFSLIVSAVLLVVALVLCGQRLF